MEEICDTEDALKGAEPLLDKSLIRREEPGRSEPRFAMLETIHEYARERLRERTDAEATCRRHAEYFLTLAEETEPVLGGPEQVAWFERLETENDNLRATISWAIGHGEAELGLRLAQALRPFWYARGHYVEGRGWVARFFGDLGELFVDAEDYAQAQYLYEEVLVLSRQLDDASRLVECLIQLSHISLFQSDHQKAMTLGEEAVALSRNRGYEAHLTRTLNCLGWAALLRVDHESRPLVRTKPRAVQRTGRQNDSRRKPGRAGVRRRSQGRSRTGGQALRRRRGGGFRAHARATCAAGALPGRRALPG
jgi:tetratricopeptide (TPR) repeat protein